MDTSTTKTGAGLHSAVSKLGSCKC